MSNPYSAYPPYPRRSTDSTAARRPSYATVAAGITNPTQTSFTTISNPANPSTSSSRPQTRGEHSRNPSYDTGMDGAGGGHGSYKSRPRWSGEVLRYEDGLHCTLHDQHPPFFTPSYLRKSRFVGRLRREWDAHLAELREAAKLAGSTGGLDRRASLSTSSSMVNLGKSSTGHGHGQGYIHRGVAQDVIERLPPASSRQDESSRALPSRWSDEDKMHGLEILGDGTEVRFTNAARPVTTDDAASIRADNAMPKECGLYYYEVTILTLSKQSHYSLAVGFSGRKTVLNRLPGWESDSWAYHGDDGNAFSSSTTGKAYGPKFEAPDVIGCGINWRTGEAFFTRNGVYLGTAFSGLKHEMSVYPSIGLKRNGDHIRANFGRQPFVFDIDAMMREERATVRAELNQADASTLHKPDDETALVNNLISQYLAHEGYIESSHAFAADLQFRAAVTPGPAPSSSGNGSDSFTLSADDDIHASQRQKIRKAILDGDIDRALKYTQSYYPLVLQDERNKEIHFRLRCRKFIEMMWRYAEISAVTNATSEVGGMDKSIESVGSNGHANGSEENGGAALTDPVPEEDEQEEDMEVDVPAYAAYNGDDIEMSTSVSSLVRPMKGNDLLSSAVAYGKELQAEFGNSPNPEVRKVLEDVFAIVAYVDPKSSVVGGLMDVRGRVGIAEGVNGAILVSLGKPKSAALEKLAAQTEALLEATASKAGGAAGMVNVQEDLLAAR
ncbi:hypothetical protein B0A48_12343 [Cryoendolithus antarcticus]|uniref:Uncharacterized protein n=1 Tax=Cryoendolithus antarcticus TaxID=1507870 RepID=A0A1V8SS16_9PEZI|nr:hypothetical protein B0A48_12343 [Cryoendolithus antarcticus]